MQDLTALMALGSDSVAGKDEVNPARRNMVMYIPDRTDDEADLRLKIFAGTHRSRCRRSCRTSRCSAWT